MAKSAHDDVLDGTPNIIKNNCDLITLCSQQPTTYTEAITTYKLADQAVDSTDFTNANGDVSGRMLTVAAQNGVTVDSSGTSNHLAYCDTVNSKLLYTNTHTGQALTAANTVDIAQHNIAKIADPT